MATEDWKGLRACSHAMPSQKCKPCRYSRTRGVPQPLEGKLEITGMSTPGYIGYAGLSPRYPLQPVGTLLAREDWKGSRACSHCDTLAEMQTDRDLQGNYPIAGHAAGRSTLCHIRSKWQAQHGPILQSGLPLRFGGVAQHITADTDQNSSETTLSSLR